MTRRYHKNLAKETRWCPRHNGGAGEELPTSKFYGHGKGSGGWCKACLKKFRREQYAYASAERRLRIRYQSLRAKCETERLPCDLTFEQFRWIISQPCVYGLYSGAGLSADAVMDIDRKIPALGYVFGNCVAACGWHNSRVKNDIFSFEDMFRLLSLFRQLRPCREIGSAKDVQRKLQLLPSKPAMPELPLFDCVRQAG